MRILTGDECGIIKETIPEVGRKVTPDFGPTNATAHHVTIDKGIQLISPDSPLSRDRSVVDMAWISPSKQFATLRADSSIEFYSMECETQEQGTYNCMSSVEDIFSIQEKNEHVSVLGMGYTKDRLCASDTIGNIAVVDPRKASVVATHFAYNSSSKEKKMISYTKGQYENKHQATAMAVHSGRVATAGRERETALLDLETGKLTWKAKNLPPDPQTLLQQPVWSTALCFMSENVFAAGTAYHQVRLYDIRTQRRPVSVTPDDMFEHRIMALCELEPEKALAVGDTTGNLFELDLRTCMFTNPPKSNPIISLPRFVGPVGSIRKLVRHDIEPILLSVGLDRMLRTYHLHTRKQLDCVYMKQRLNCALFCEDEQWTMDEKGQDVDVDIDVEDDVNDYIDSDREEEDDDDSEESGGDEESVNNGGSSNSSSHDEDSDTDSSDSAVSDNDSLPTKKKQRHQ